MSATDPGTHAETENATGAGRETERGSGSGTGRRKGEDTEDNNPALLNTKSFVYNCETLLKLSLFLRKKKHKLLFCILEPIAHVCFVHVV